MRPRGAKPIMFTTVETLSMQNIAEARGQIIYS
jgi:hypothetical protein